MYKFITFLFILVTFTFSQNFSYGFSVGANYSNVRFDVGNGDYGKSIKDYNRRSTSTVFGMFAKLPLSKSFSLQPELVYSIKGFTVKHSDENDASERNSYRYLEVPILGIYHLTETFSIVAGPYFSYLLNAKIETENYFSIAESKNEQNTNGTFNTLEVHEINSVDYGFTIGSNYSISKIISVSARYSFGAVSIADSHKFGESSGIHQRNDAAKNENFQFILNYLL